MNRRILIQVSAPAVVIGLLLFAACIASAWYINRLQKNTANILSQHVASLRAAQELEIYLRQLRFHSFVYLIDPRPQRLGRIDDDHKHFEQALVRAQESANDFEKRAYVEQISAAYRKYRDELGVLRRQAPPKIPADFAKLADAHPVNSVVQPCADLLKLNEELLKETSRENDRVSTQARSAMLLLGLLGPVSGLIGGYGIARGLSRSIYRLGVRVQDMAERLEQDVASISISADGDIQNLDKQLQQVVVRVEEVAQRLQRHQREMLRAEQLSAVGRLAASVAHEVRNPLTAVKMLIDVALRAQNPKSLTPDDLRIIHRELARVESSVQNLLDFARLPSPQKSLCDLRSVVAQARDLVQARARQQHVRFDVRCPDYPVEWDVDRSQLCTVLVNLFFNALDAMPQGGTIGVDLDGTSEGRAMSLALAGVGIRLSVWDTGPGIAPEILSRLFMPFASTKSTGTGLGLNISQRIVAEHGGCLTAANRLGGGACFTITLGAEERATNGTAAPLVASGRAQPVSPSVE